MCQNNKRRKRQKFDLKLFKSSDHMKGVAAYATGFDDF
jgi:hypothetical protein